MAITNTPSPGAPIRSDWAISITDEVNLRKVTKAGDTMTGDLYVGGDPVTTNANRVAANGLIVTACGQIGTPSVTVTRTGTGGAANVGEQFVRFNRRPTDPATTIGSIAIASATSVAFNTTSDRRLKEATGDAGDALGVAAALGALVYRGRWIADQGTGEEWLFVNSQDVEPVAPYAVHGAGDAVTTAADVSEGRADTAGVVIPQQLDHGALVPLLLAAIAQLEARVAELETGAAA